MKSFIDRPLGEERSIIKQEVLSFLGTALSGEDLNFLKGVEQRGLQYDLAQVLSQ